MTVSRLSDGFSISYFLDPEVWVEFVSELILPTAGIVLEISHWKSAKWLNIGCLTLAGAFWLVEAA